MSRSADPAAFYVVGGTVPRDAPSYVTRKADEELLYGLRTGQFCYVLTSRQMGKSSLMVRAATHLRREGVAVAALDLTAIGINVTAEQWYQGLSNLLGRALDLEDEIEANWFRHRGLSPHHRWLLGLRDIVLARVQGRIVIFVDEIDVVRALPFSADEFFAGIRECYNRRADDPDMRRLTFCLLGVATPGDLIRDTRNTPFNVGRRIELTDFADAEARPLAAGLAGAVHGPQAADRLLARILEWSGGQPYLTQRLCKAVAERLPVGRTWPGPEALRGTPNVEHRTPKTNQERLLSSIVRRPSPVDAVCAELFLDRGAHERDDNLLFVRDRLLRSDADVASLLDLFRRVWEGAQVEADETNPLVSQLMLSGVVTSRNGRLVVRNRIYRHVFDRAWLTEHMPHAERRRQRTAYRRGAWRAATVSAAILSLAAAAAVFAVLGVRAQDESRAAKRLADERQQALLVARLDRDAAARAAAAAVHAQRLERSERRRAEAARAAAERATQREELERRSAVHQRRVADASRTRAEIQRLRAERAERERKAEALLDRARSLRYRGTMGQQVASLQDIASASQLATTPPLRMELRNEAIACLSLEADLRPVAQLTSTRPPTGEGVVCTLPDIDRVMTTDRVGNVTISRLRDHSVLRVLPGSGVFATAFVRGSDDLRYMVVAYVNGDFVLWDTLNSRQVWSRHQAAEYVADVAADGRLAAVTADEHVTILSLPNGRALSRIASPGYCCAVRLSPDGRQLAMSGYGEPGATVVDLASRHTRALAATSSLHDLSWHSDGTRIAGAGVDGRVYVWDTRTAKLIASFAGHARDAVSVEFAHRGDLLASAGWDRTVHLWDIGSGRSLVTANCTGMTLRFGRYDRLLVASSMPATSVFEVIRGTDVRRVAATQPSEMTWAADFSPDGRWIAVGTDSGIRLVDACRLVTVATLQVGDTHFVTFSRNGGWLVAGGARGVLRWPVQFERVRDPVGRVAERLDLGPCTRLRVGVPGGFVAAAGVGAGRCLAAAQEDRVDFIDEETGSRLQLIHSPYSVGSVSASPDGRYLATGSWANRGAPTEVWDVRTGRKAADLPVHTRAYTTFTRNGKFLMTGEESQIRLWTCGTWRPAATIRREESWTWCPIATSRDGDMIALATAPNRVQLYDAASRQPLAILSSTDDAEIGFLTFSPDGESLVAGGTMLRIWDLRRLRRRLAALRLDWQTAPAGAGTPALQLQVRISPGERLSDTAARQWSDHLEAILARSPEDADAANELAWLMVMGPPAVRDADAAIRLARRAVERAPKNASYWNTLGVSLYRHREFAEAANVLRRSLAMSGDAFAAHNLYPLAVCCLKLGRAAEAAAAYTAAGKWRSSHLMNDVWYSDIECLRVEADAALGSPR